MYGVQNVEGINVFIWGFDGLVEMAMVKLSKHFVLILGIF